MHALHTEQIPWSKNAYYIVVNYGSQNEQQHLMSCDNRTSTTRHSLALQMLFWGPLKNTMEQARAFKMAKRNVERDENHRISDHQAFTEYILF